jgi:hypothetical protein
MDAGRKARPPLHLRGMDAGQAMALPCLLMQSVATSMRCLLSQVRTAVWPNSASSAASKAESGKDLVLLGKIPCAARAAVMLYCAR